MKPQRQGGGPLHSGIRIEKINFQGAMGLVFVATILFLSLVGLPGAGWFLAAAAGVGAAIAVVLHFTARDR